MDITVTKIDKERVPISKNLTKASLLTAETSPNMSSAKLTVTSLLNHI
jgi:hypothetical protein